MTRILLFTFLLVTSAVTTAQQPTRPGWPQPMHNNPKIMVTRFNQNEMRMRDGAHLYRWEAESSYGGNINKLWAKTEGKLDTDSGKFDEAEIQLLGSHAISRFFNLQYGARYDFKPEPNRKWAVVGVEGLAPLFWELGGYVFLGPEGRWSARVEAMYDENITQRLVLQPQFELNWYSGTDAARGVGSGLSELDSGLRLRYEFSRQFAPYLGVTYNKKYGNTADLAKSEGEPVDEFQFTAGIKIWF